MQERQNVRGISQKFDIPESRFYSESQKPN